MDFNKLIFDLPSADYHGMKGSYSSSQLKTMLKDPEVFHNKYILCNEEKLSIPAFDIGTYFHTAILEPEKLLEECAVYDGGIRSGGKWEAFKEANPNKAIVTKKDVETADKLIAAINGSPISMGFLKDSKPEVSAFIEVYVINGEVLSIKDGTIHTLVSTGWCAGSEYDDEDDVKQFGTKLVLKTRADALGIGTGTISDLKSTTGNCKNAYEMQGKVNSYEYDLSAALYLDVFTMASGEDYHSFIWLFASKDMGNAKAYRASDRNIQVGRAKWKKAVVDLAFYINNKWEFTDSLGEIGPSIFNLEWLER